MTSVSNYLFPSYFLFKDFLSRTSCSVTGGFVMNMKDHATVDCPADCGSDEFSDQVVQGTKKYSSSRYRV